MFQLYTSLYIHLCAHFLLTSLHVSVNDGRLVYDLMELNDVVCLWKKKAKKDMHDQSMCIEIWFLKCRLLLGFDKFTAFVFGTKKRCRYSKKGFLYNSELGLETRSSAWALNNLVERDFSSIKICDKKGWWIVLIKNRNLPRCLRSDSSSCCDLWGRKRTSRSFIRIRSKESLVTFFSAFTALSWFFGDGERAVGIFFGASFLLWLCAWKVGWTCRTNVECFTLNTVIKPKGPELTSTNFILPFEEVALALLAFEELSALVCSRLVGG